MSLVTMLPISCFSCRGESTNHGQHTRNPRPHPWSHVLKLPLRHDLKCQGYAHCSEACCHRFQPLSWSSLGASTPDPSAVRSATPARPSPQHSTAREPVDENLSTSLLQTVQRRASHQAREKRCRLLNCPQGPTPFGQLLLFLINSFN